MGWHGVEESLLSNAMRGAVAVQQSRVLGKSEGAPSEVREADAVQAQKQCLSHKCWSKERKLSSAVLPRPPRADSVKRA